MISESAIIEWRNTVPWSDVSQVEQDLIICRSLTAIYNDDFLSRRLAFRGGTAIHKLYLSPQPRHSVDIDLVQVNSEPIKPTIDRLREVLSFLGEPRVKQKMNNNTLIFKTISSIPPLFPIKLKVEINCRDHFHVLDFDILPFSIINQWFTGSCNILTYQLDELIATKVKALYERRKGRDLFDLFTSLQDKRLNADNVMTCFIKLMENEGRTLTHSQFIANVEEKLKNKEFLGDTKDILRPDTVYDPFKAYEYVKKELLDRLA
jgi:predicted nucleotidyltransferase component of viral defense system